MIMDSMDSWTPQHYSMIQRMLKDPIASLKIILHYGLKGCFNNVVDSNLKRILESNLVVESLRILKDAIGS